MAMNKHRKPKPPKDPLLWPTIIVAIIAIGIAAYAIDWYYT